MVLSLSYAAVVRCGVADIKKAGLSSLKGWKERWLILKNDALLVYKNSSDPGFMLRLSLASITRIESKQTSGDRSRCLSLSIRGGARYLFSFPSDGDLAGWFDDLNSMSPLVTVLIPCAESALGVEEIIESYLDDYTLSPSTRADTPDSLDTNADEITALSLQLRSDAGPSRLHISSTPNLCEYTDPIPPRTPPAPLDGCELKPHQRAVIRKAISILCTWLEPRLLRRSDPGGEKPFDLIEIRLRPLIKVKTKWTKQHDARIDFETISAMSESLQDGYVLCQVLNTIGSSPLIRPNGDRDTINIAKFLSHCRDIGVPSERLCTPADITATTAQSSVRVARTIIALAKMTDSADRKATTKDLVNFSKSGVSHLPQTSPLSSLEASVDHFIASRVKKSTLRYDNATLRDASSGNSSQIVKVHRNLVSFLQDRVVDSVHRERLNNVLTKLVNFMASLDAVSSLVESRQSRIRLLQLYSELNGSDYRTLREALKADDVELAKLLRAAVESDDYKHIVLGFHGEDAQNCVDVIQDVLDRRSLKDDLDDNFYHQAQRLLVKLSESRDIIPTSLFIRGVNRQDSHACYGGTFGDIYRATYKNQDVALKRIRVFQGDVGRLKLQRRFCREALLWQRLHHPFVLPFCGIDSESFPSFLCMTSPWMRHGTILKHLNEFGYANVEHRLFEVAQGLAYLHSQHVVHGDLRGSNILVNDDWHACLADFGLAVFGDATAAESSNRSGSTRFMAPELHDPQAFGLQHFRRTFESDVYSFACVCIELFTGKPPFANIPRDPAVMLRVMASERPERPTDAFGRSMSDQLWEIVQQCWRHDPSKRPSMPQVIGAMKAANGNLEESVVEPPSEALDWDASLHSVGGTTLVRGRRLGSRSAAVRRPSGFPFVHKTSRSS